MIYVLMLNDMRSSQIEIVAPRAWATSEEPLKRLLETERVEPYRDERWGKSFRRGGPLEWCNPPTGDMDGIIAVNAEVVSGVPTWAPKRVSDLDGTPRID